MKRLTLPGIFCFIMILSYGQDSETLRNLSFDELNDIILGHWDKGDYKEGILTLETYLNKAKEEKNDSLIYDGINRLGLFNWAKGSYNTAVDFFKEGRMLSDSLFGKTDARYATSLSNLAHLYQLVGKPQRALPLLLESLERLQETVGKNHLNYTTASNNLAIFYADQGDYDKAEKYYLTSIDIIKNLEGEKNKNYSNYINNLAELYREIRQPERALPLYAKAKSIIKQISGTNNIDYARLLSNQGIAQRMLGNYEQALPLYLQAKEITESIGMERHPFYSTILNNLAFLYQLLDQNELATKFHREAIKTRETIYGVDHPRYATSLINFARYLSIQQMHEEALSLLIQAKDIRENYYGKLHTRYASVLFEIGKVFEAKEDFDEAISYMTETKSIREVLLSEKHPAYLLTLHNLARIHLKAKQYKPCKTLIQSIIQGIASDSIPLTFDEKFLDAILDMPYNSYEQLDLLPHTLDLAFQLVERDDSFSNKKERLNIITEVVNELLTKARNAVVNERDKLRLLSVSHNWLQRSLHLLDPDMHASEAFELADKNKSVLLLQATQSETNYRLGNLPDSLIWYNRKLLKTQSELQANLLENQSETKLDTLLDEINEVNQSIDEFVRMVAKEYPKYHKVKYQQTDAAVPELQSSLNKSQALLEYVVGDSILHIFYIDQSNIQWAKVPIASSELSKRIQSLHNSLSNYESDSAYIDFSQQAHWFYKVLMAPVLAGRSDIKDLIIVPDGELAHLPFETFLIKSAPQYDVNYQKLDYLLKEYNISYNYSATLWKENVEAPSPRNNGQILGIAGNYQTKIDSSLIAFRLPTDQWRRDGLIQLPAAREEVALLQTKYQGYFAFDSLASEKNVKARVSDYSILHFATHGILDNERPMLSSLALSEDRDSIESNFWQAYEISKSRLNANLVVLSACETGYGKFETGNGVASLARAFMYAGARSLVVSLWQVHDNSTSRLMGSFYAQLDRGINKDAALRNAKLEYLESAKGIYAHPAFWSSFVLMGKTDRVKIKSKGPLNTWSIGIFMLLLLSIGGYLWSRKRAARI